MFIRALMVLGTKDKAGNGPITPGFVAEVADDIGRSFVKRGLAVEVSIPEATDVIPDAPVREMGENPSEGGNARKAPENAQKADDLESKSYNELKAIAKGMGIDAGRIKSKSGMIQAIQAADDAPPAFDAQEVIDE